MVLGGLFILAGYNKLGDFRGTYDAVHAFHLGFNEQTLQVLARVVPWAELLTGSLLVLGLWARGAGVMAVVLMAAFIGGIASVMARGLDVNCGCFGKLKLFCGDQPMGWCHLIRNTIMAGAAALIVACGPGVMALDNLRKRGTTTP
jgi:uncharacterized membrane protein YphA (DoxX/SURF4 family)